MANVVNSMVARRDQEKSNRGDQTVMAASIVIKNILQSLILRRAAIDATQRESIGQQEAFAMPNSLNTEPG
jgi:hypothetical protein